MNRERVNSSNIHSIGHDETGLEVQFHAKACAKRIDQVPELAECNCPGGGVYHYPTVTADEHALLMAADSIGSHFMEHIRNAKDDKGKPKHPATFIPAEALSR